MDQPLAPQSNPLTRPLIGFALLALVIIAAWCFATLRATGGMPGLSAPSDTGFYYYNRSYTNTNIKDGEAATSSFAVYQVAADAAHQDKEVFRHVFVGQPIFIEDSGKSGSVILVSSQASSSQVYTLSLPRGSLTQVADIPMLPGERAYVARFVEGGSTLAYITATERNARAAHSILHLRKGDATRDILLSEESPLYAGFSFVAEDTTAHKLYLDESGGDGGMIWSTWYSVDLESGVVAKLDRLPPYGSDDLPVSAAFSPDGSAFAYTSYSTKIDPEDINYGAFPRCLEYSPEILNKYAAEGGTVMLYNFSTGTSTELYRSLVDPENICKNVEREIRKVRWIDAKTLAVQTIEGVYSLDIATGATKPLFLYPARASVEDVNEPWLVAARPPYVFFNTKGLGQLGSAAIGNSLTNKAISVPGISVHGSWSSGELNTDSRFFALPI